MQQADGILHAGAVPLATWRAIYFGADVHLDDACRPRVEAGARAIERVVAAGAPVYGVNTGFGKLASVRIETPTSRRCNATSCSRTAPASAIRCRCR